MAIGLLAAACSNQPSPSHDSPTGVEEPPAAPMDPYEPGRSFPAALAELPERSVLGDPSHAWERLASAHSPSGKRFVETYAGGGMRVWDVATQKLLDQFELEQPAVGVTFANDEDTLISWNERQVAWWRIGQPRPIEQLSNFVCPEKDCKLWQVRPAHAADLLFTLGGRDQVSSLLAWSLTDGSRVAGYNPAQTGDWTLAFEFSPGQRWLISYDLRGVGDTYHATYVRRVPIGEPTRAESVACPALVGAPLFVFPSKVHQRHFVSEDQLLLCAQGSPKQPAAQVCVVDLHAPDQTRTFMTALPKTGVASCDGMGMSPDGSRVAIRRRECLADDCLDYEAGEIESWEVATGKRLEPVIDFPLAAAGSDLGKPPAPAPDGLERRSPYHRTHITAVGLGPSGRAFTLSEGQVLLWSIANETPAPIRELEFDADFGVLAPDGRTLLLSDFATVLPAADGAISGGLERQGRLLIHELDTERSLELDGNTVLGPELAADVGVSWVSPTFAGPNEVWACELHERGAPDRLELVAARFVRIGVDGRVEPFGAKIDGCALGRAFAPAARRALVATKGDASNYNYAVIDVDSGEIILDRVTRPDRQPGRFARAIVEAELSSTGHRLLVWTHGAEPSSESFELWDVEAGVVIGKARQGTSMALSLDGRRAALGFGSIDIFDLTKASDNLLDEQPTDLLGDRVAMITGVSFSPDGAHVLSGSIEAVGRFWTL